MGGRLLRRRQNRRHEFRARAPSVKLERYSHLMAGSPGGCTSRGLLETPIMITVMVFAARWILRRFELRVLPARLATGVFALIFLLAAEFGVAILLRGMSASEVITKRDPVSGTVYFISLVVFALMPTFVSHFTSEAGS